MRLDVVKSVIRQQPVILDRLASALRARLFPIALSELFW